MTSFSFDFSGEFDDSDDDVVSGNVVVVVEMSLSGGDTLFKLFS